jgi:alpha,alpha-trehalose phosphorylase
MLKGENLGKQLVKQRELDLREGVLRRAATWTSPTGRAITVSSTCLVSFTQRAIAAISCEVEPLDAPVRIVMQSELVANETLPGAGTDPRAGTISLPPLESEEHEAQHLRGLLIHHTWASRLRIGAAMDHLIEGPEGMMMEAESTPNIARVSISVRLRLGERLRISKFLAYGWSSQRSQSAIHDQLIAALTAARSTGWEGLLAEQRDFLQAFWKRPSRWPGNGLAISGCAAPPFPGEPFMARSVRDTGQRGRPPFILTRISRTQLPFTSPAPTIARSSRR